VVVTPVDSPRSASLEDLLAAARTTGSEVEAAPGGISALESALRTTPANGLVVVTGSVYLVGQVRPLLMASRPAPTEPLEV
jgi:dihydrofolate synthase/folylpolyglutamate synthase